MNCNPVEAYALINAMVKEATGGTSTAQAIDTSSFVACGDLLLNLGTENVLNALSNVLSRTLVEVRPYEAKLKLIDAEDSMQYAMATRSIVFRTKNAIESGYFNTNVNRNLATGFDNGSNGGQSVASMWEQHHPNPVQINFASNVAWDYCITVTESQLKNAFVSEDEFMSFVSGALTEASNDIEREKEAWNRVTLLNRIAANIDLAKDGDADILGGRDDYGKASMAINLVKAFNDEFGTTYTKDDLKTTYLKEFLQFLAYTIKKYSNAMTYSTGEYHYQYPEVASDGTKVSLVLRDTPKSRQNLMLYAPLLYKAESLVFPEIFNPQYLKVENYEGVEFWQNFKDGMSINVTPRLPSLVEGAEGGIGQAVNVDIVGILFDDNAIKTRVGFESTYTTPIEARKGYRNTWTHFNKGAVNKYFESAIVFYME